MLDFLNQSKTFSSICFQGSYDMPLEHFSKLYEHYKQTGENLLDDYSEVTYCIWDVSKYTDSRYEGRPVVDKETFDKTMRSISKMRKIRLFDPYDLQMCMSYIQEWHREHREWLRNNSEHIVKRREACAYTSRKDIRKAVFELHGKKCLKCGATNKIHLDHVVPVSKGGENDISNLQPLCKACNSQKSDKIIDYRI